MTATLTNKKTSNYGTQRNHFDIEVFGEKIGQAGHGSEAFAQWSFMSLDGKTYKTFSSKAKLLAYAVAA